MLNCFSVSTTEGPKQCGVSLLRRRTTRCYLVLEDIFRPEIEAAAKENPDYLASLMTFVEAVAKGDNHRRDLVAIGLGEYLPSSKYEEIIRAAAGPVTRRLIFCGDGDAHRTVSSWTRENGGSRR